MQSSCWALAVTAPRREFAASAGLVRASFPHHLFMQRVNRVIKGQPSSILIPAFPRYIFVLVDDRQWMSLLEIIGIIGYVRSLNGEPTEVDESVITNLLGQSRDDVLMLPEPETALGFRFGDRIRIYNQENVAFGCEGIYQYPTKAGHSLVLMPWLGQMVNVEVNDFEIEQTETKKRQRRRHRRKRRRGRFVGRPNSLVARTPH